MNIHFYLFYLLTTNISNITSTNNQIPSETDETDNDIDTVTSIMNNNDYFGNMNNFDTFDNNQFSIPDGEWIFANDERIPCNNVPSYFSYNDTSLIPEVFDYFNEPSPKEFYDLILSDDCTLKSISTGFIRRKANVIFEGNVDETGLNRSPLHVAIDNRSLKCIRYILKHFCKDLTLGTTSRDKERVLLQQKDLRGWRAIEHSLENYPYVESLVLPSDDLEDLEKIGKLITFAMRQKPLKSLDFLVNLSTRMTNPQDRFKIAMKVLHELVNFTDRNSLSSLIFLDQYLQEIKFKNMEVVVANASEEIKGLIFYAIKEDCFLIPRHKVLLGCLRDEEIKEIIHDAINMNKPSLSREIFVTWKGLANFSDEFRSSDPSKFDDFLEELKELEQSESFYKTLALAFYPEYFDKNHHPLMIKLETFEGMTEVDQVKFFERIPAYVFGTIPTVLVVALHNPEMINAFYYYRREYFTETIEIEDSAYIYNDKLYKPKPIDILSCYCPETYPSESLKMGSLAFVMSERCNSPAEVKSDAVMKLLTEPKKYVKFLTKMNPRNLKWEVLQPLCFGATSMELIEVIAANVSMGREDIITGAAKLLNEPIPYSIIADILKKCNGQLGLELVDRLMNYGEAENDPEALNEIDQILSELINTLPDHAKVIKARLPSSTSVSNENPA